MKCLICIIILLDVHSRGATESLTKYLTDAWAPLETVEDGEIISARPEIRIPENTTEFHAICTLTGMLKPTIPFPELDTDIAHFPENCRPARALMFVQLAEFGPIRIDLWPNGTLRIPEGPNLFYVRSIGFGRWVTLDGIAFFPAGQAEEESLSPYLQDSWTSGYEDFHGAHYYPTYSTCAPTCVVSGAVQTDSTLLNDSLVAVLPESCRPLHDVAENGGRSVFLQQSQNRAVRVDLSTDGSIRVMAAPENWFGSNPPPYGNMIFFKMRFPIPGSPLCDAPTYLDLIPHLSDSWGHNTEFIRPRYRISSECHLTGVVVSKTPQDVGSTIATLPKPCRPANPHTYVQQAELGILRLDLTPDGRLIISADYPNKIYHFREKFYGKWVGLDGIEFEPALEKESTFPSYGYVLIAIGAVFVLFLCIYTFMRWWRSRFRIIRLDTASFVPKEDFTDSTGDATNDVHKIELE